MLFKIECIFRLIFNCQIDDFNRLKRLETKCWKKENELNYKKVVNPMSEFAQKKKKKLCFISIFKEKDLTIMNS